MKHVYKMINRLTSLLDSRKQFVDPVGKEFASDNVFILHHLGLGDHIICNGLVRHISPNFDNLFLFSKLHNFESVKWMYRDCEKIHVIPIINDRQACDYIISNNISKLINIGYSRPRLKKINIDARFRSENRPDYKSLLKTMRFDHAFYEQMGIDFQTRWGWGEVQRNSIREEALINKLNINSKKYAFIHDHPARNFILNDDLVHDKTLKIIRPSPQYTSNIYDYCALLEHADEIHCMDSSFKHLAESLHVKVKHLCLYKRSYEKNNLSSSSLLNWQIL